MKFWVQSKQYHIIIEICRESLFLLKRKMLYDFANTPLLTSKIGKKEVSSWQERLLFPYLHLISVHIQLYFHLLYVRFN